jgi:hypothetical protein
MGVVMVEGAKLALLGRRDGGPPLRARAGQAIEDLKYRISRIEKQAIHLQDERGVPHVLKNTRFGGE